jgi:transcriptional regulator with XRE-family HTH domain
VDVSFVIRQRLEELGLDQKDLARAARVTESYVSQLLTRKRSPPAPNRTDIYDRMDKVLRLPNGELARLADIQRKEGLKRELDGETAPLFREVRELVLRKCKPANAEQVRDIFEHQPFGELERLVTRKLLDVTKQAARHELDNEQWLRTVARLRGRSFEEARVVALEFLDTDIFHVSAEHCASFLDPLVESWDIDLATFALEVHLSGRATGNGDQVRRFEFSERESPGAKEEPGFKEFLEDDALSATATEPEIEFLKRLRFQDRRPTALYYYRELQSLRDPLHFRPSAPAR